MEPKPAQWSAGDAAVFTDGEIAAAYPHRPPYPEEAVRLLVDLVRDHPRTVLDLGCGNGDLARRLAPEVERVDAVDPSAAMLAKGRQLPGGDHPHLRWQRATAETAALTPPYALVTAGESLHWMDWEVLFARLARVRTPGGVLAIVERDWNGPLAVSERLGPVFARYSTVRDFRAMDVVTEIERRGLFTRIGERRCGPEAWRPTLDGYLRGRHSQRGFAHMDRDAAVAFDAAVRAILADLVGTDGRLDLAVEARVVWGVPG
jgi:SAM-dependent methyltransferase